MLAKQPDRLGIRHLVAEPQPEKAHEGQPVLNLEFGLVVRQPIKRLQNQDLEHHHRIVRRPATLGAIGALQRLGHRLAEYIPRNHCIQLLQRITRFAQPHIALINVPEPCLSPHRLPPQINARIESKSRSKGEGF